MAYESPHNACVEVGEGDTGLVRSCNCVDVAASEMSLGHRRILWHSCGALRVMEGHRRKEGSKGEE